MPEPSLYQKQFLLHQKQERQFVTVTRILVFFLFLGIWEISARTGLIDSFIFSSPSQIADVFYTMCRDQSLFSHIGITLGETLISFFFV